MWDQKTAENFLTPTLSREFILEKPLIKLLGPLKGKSILEFGCGNGYWLRIFHARGALCTGVDISSHQIGLAKSLGDENITYIKQDCADIILKKRFDMVFMDHVISETDIPFLERKTHKTNDFQTSSILAQYESKELRRVGSWSLWREILGSTKIEEDERVAKWVTEYILKKEFRTRDEARPILKSVRNRLRNLNTKVLSDRELTTKLGEI